MKRVNRASFNRLRPIVIIKEDPEAGREPNLEDLKKEFPFKWRVQSYSKARPMAICVPFCDARQVADILDEVCGTGGWQDKYEDVGGVKYCRIGIKVKGEWVWKGDCGKESQIEKEKGESSDAFKRAAVKWGVGRFLYSMRTYNLTASKKKEQGDGPYQLHCVDNNGGKIPDWCITDYINDKRGTTLPVPASDKEAKGPDSLTEVETFNKWVEEREVDHLVIAQNWINSVYAKDITCTEKDIKTEGVDVSRANYGTFCHLVCLARFDGDLVDMTLEGFGFKPVSEGGISEVIGKEMSEKILKECRVIARQEATRAD